MKIEHYGKIEPLFTQNRAHKQNSLSPQNCKGEMAGCPYHRNLCCLLLFLTSISPSTTEVQWQMSHMAVMKTLPVLESSQHRQSWVSTLPFSYSNGQEEPCFSTLFPSVAEPYFRTHTHTHTVLFTVVQHSHFSFEASQKRVCSSEQNKHEKYHLKNVVPSPLEFSCPVLSRALPSNSGFLYRCQRADVNV